MPAIVLPSQYILSHNFTYKSIVAPCDWDVYGVGKGLRVVFGEKRGVPAKWLKLLILLTLICTVHGSVYP